MSTKPVKDLKVKLFADGAERTGILKMYENPLIRGFTTNPTLMRKAGITDYEAFAKDIVSAVPDRPLSLEVFADEFDEMERQALKISRWGDNVYTKIPVTNTRRESSLDLICRLARQGVKLNVTAMMTLDQVRDVSAALAGGPAAYVSVFAGRIADTGRDPVPIMADAVELLQPYSNIELIWASPRELLNIFQADSGKGRMLLLAAEYPFRKIQGLEIALQLHHQAEQNISRYRHARQRCTVLESINVDALEYVFPEGNLVLYLFNPFLPEVLIAQHPRHVIVIMLNPVFGFVIEAMPFLRLYLETRRFRIYQSANA
jgi:transaldolase